MPQHSEQQDDEGYTVVPDFTRFIFIILYPALFGDFKGNRCQLLSAGRTEALPLNFTSPRFSPHHKCMLHC